MSEDEDQAMLDLDDEVKYSTPHAPSFTLHLSNDDTVQAVGGIMTVTRAQSVAIEKLARARPDIRSHLVKIDMDAAAALVAQHMALQKPAAVQGAVSAGSKTIDELRAAKQGQTAEALTGSSNPQAPPGPTAVSGLQILDDKQPVTTDAAVAKRPNGVLGRLNLKP